MKSLTFSEYQKLIENSEVLEQDCHGLKVLKTPDGLIVKLFRQKRLISSTLLKSYASRFVENAKALEKKSINTIKVIDVVFCSPIKRTLVFYQPIPGQTLREVLDNVTQTDEIIERFGLFFAALHAKGIFFRSIHLSNVIVSDDLQTFGLIDFADMKIASKSLSRVKRLRNFRHLAKYKADQDSIKSFGLARFMDIYFDACDLPGSYKAEFLAKAQEMFNAKGKVLAQN